MTDVTGFGLLGHLIEMAEGSGLSATIHYPAIQKLPGVAEYLKQKTIPDATFRNWNSYSKKVQFEKGVDVMEAFNLLPDPQTNGGLLIAVAEAGVIELNEILSRGGYPGLQPIGRLTAEGEKRIVVSV